jgi:hypothetical protein
VGNVEETNVHSVVVRMGDGQIVHIPNIDVLKNPFPLRACSHSVGSVARRLHRGFGASLLARSLGSSSGAVRCRPTRPWRASAPQRSACPSRHRS